MDRKIQAPPAELVRLINFFLVQSRKGQTQGKPQHNLSTLLVFYRNYVEFLLYLYQDLIVLISVKEHCIFTKYMHRFPL